MIWSVMRRRAKGMLAILVALLISISCNLGIPNSDASLTHLPRVLIATAAPTVTPDVLAGLPDATQTMAGVCFEAAFNRRDTPYVIRSAAQLQRFFDEVDEEQSCRRAIARGTFDFSENRVLVGLWSFGMGCTASHTITQLTRDESSRTLTITATLTIGGECNYELLRPLWLAVQVAGDWQVSLEIVRP